MTEDLGLQVATVVEVEKYTELIDDTELSAGLDIHDETSIADTAKEIEGTTVDEDAIDRAFKNNTEVYIPNIIPLKNKYITHEELLVEEISVPKASGKGTTVAKYTHHRKDLHPYVVFDDTHNKKKFTINYELITGDKEYNNDDGELDLLVTSTIDMRAYASTVDTIINDMSYIINEYPEFAMVYLEMKKKIYFEKDYSSDDFYNDIVNFVSQDARLRDIVHSMVSSVYTLDLNGKVEVDRKKKVKIIPDLQVTDETNKMLLESAILLRVVIPLMCEYLATTKMDKADKERFIIKTFKTILVANSISDDIYILNKVFKIVQARVKNTLYKHKVMWSWLVNVSKSEPIVIHEIENSIYKSIISKMHANTSSIAFLDVVIKRKLDFIFQYNYPYTYKPYKVSGSDEDIDESDKLSLQLQHDTNELDDATNAYSIIQYLKANIADYNITNELIMEVKNHLKSINEFQRSILRMYFDDDFIIKDFKSPNVLILLIILSKKLEEDNFPMISKLLLSRRTDEPTRRISTRKPTKVVTDSTDYRELMNKYQEVSTLMSNRNVIIDYISIPMAYSFEYYRNNEIIEDIDKNAFTHEIINLIKIL